MYYIPLHETNGYIGKFEHGNYGKACLESGGRQAKLNQPAGQLPIWTRVAEGKQFPITEKCNIGEVASIPTHVLNLNSL